MCSLFFAVNREFVAVNRYFLCYLFADDSPENNLMFGLVELGDDAGGSREGIGFAMPPVEQLILKRLLPAKCFRKDW